MKNPLRYQLTEYDCGPTAMLDAISYLFEREHIPPEVIRYIHLYCLDCYGTDGECGKCGTSCAAMRFLSNWLNGFGDTGKLPVASRYLSGKKVYLGEGSAINRALSCGGVAVVRLFFDEWHYALITGASQGNIYMFDPYYKENAFEQEDIRIVTDHPFSYNRILPETYLNFSGEGIYALGPEGIREAVLVFDRSHEKYAEYQEQNL